MTPDTDDHGWSEASIDQRLDLVLLQWNRFIRAFPSSKGLRLGTAPLVGIAGDGS